MPRDDLRDPHAERRWMRRSVVLVVAVAALAVGAATLAAFANRPADHHYVFYATYGNTNDVPYTLLLPLPADAELQATWRFFGKNNGTASVEASPYGTVLRVEAFGNITVSANLSTWRDLPAAFTTEGTSAAGRGAARLFLNASAPVLGSFVQVTFTKSDPAWTLTRTLEGDLFGGWNTFEVKETVERTVAR